MNRYLEKIRDVFDSDIVQVGLSLAEFGATLVITVASIYYLLATSIPYLWLTLFTAGYFGYRALEDLFYFGFEEEEDYGGEIDESLLEDLEG